MTTTLTRELERLTTSGLRLADPADDIRGREVLDQSGEHVGTIADLLVERDTGVARLAEVASESGMFGIGRKARLVPLDVITVGDARTVYIERSRGEILAVDAYRPGDPDDEEAQYASAYAAFGRPPHWTRRGS